VPFRERDDAAEGVEPVTRRRFRRRDDVFRREADVDEDDAVARDDHEAEYRNAPAVLAHLEGAVVEDPQPLRPLHAAIIADVGLDGQPREERR
jgi:hypothetical protein